MGLDANQVRDRNRLKEVCKTEEEILASCISIAKCASHLASFIIKNSDFLNIPQETMYRCALVTNFCMMMWGECSKPDQLTIAKYKKELSDQDIDGRFKMVFMFLYDEAIKKGWVK